MKSFEKIEKPYKLRLADAETAKARLVVCKKCDKYDGEKCGLCNCLMSKKAWFQEAECGKNKWQN